MDKQAKEALCQYYYEQYGVETTKQQRFVLNPERLRELLIRKATKVQWDKAAAKIQNWFKGRLNRAKFMKRLRSTVRAVRTIQRNWRYFAVHVLRPRKQRAREENATGFV